MIDITPVTNPNYQYSNSRDSISSPSGGDGESGSGERETSHQRKHVSAPSQSHSSFGRDFADHDSKCLFV
jgi:hypothetical protein